MATSVNGQLITDEAIQHEYDRLYPYYVAHARENEANVSESQLRDWARENLVERLLVQQSAARMPEPDAEAVDEAVVRRMSQMNGGSDGDGPQADPDTIRAEIIADLKGARLLEEITEDLKPPKHAEIAMYYEMHIDRFTSPDAAHVMHIVKHPESPDFDQAREILTRAQEQLQSGRAFEDVAREFSDCPESGGDLGTFTRGSMVDRFEAVVFSLEPGQISPIFETEFGLHIATVVKHLPGEPAPLESVYDTIAEELARNDRDMAIEAFVDQLKNDAKIEEVSGK